MKISVSPDEFFTLIMIYLLDKMNNKDKIGPWSKEIEDIMEKIKVIKPYLINIYLNSESNEKIFYKRIRDVFQKTDFSGSYVIAIKDRFVEEGFEKIDTDIINESDLIEEKKIDNIYELKEVVKEVIKKIKNRKFKTSRYLSEEELNKIISNVIIKEGE